MKVLHLSDTTLSGAPGRLSNVFDKYSGHESRHLVWDVIPNGRVFEYDLCSATMNRGDIIDWLDWADIIHYHNRYERQNIFKAHNITPPNKPSLIQIHSPRESENFKPELESGIPIAVIAQYHVRQWPELRFIVPNVVDIYDPTHMPGDRSEKLTVAYSPSSPTGKGWDNKSYNVVAPILRRMYLNREIQYLRIAGLPHTECLKLKQVAHIGIDEVSTGSYHMSSLEFLSMGVATLCGIDTQCEKVIKDLTGADWLPWVVSNEIKFKEDINRLVKNKDECIEIGLKARQWVETYWNPKDTAKYFLDLYTKL